MTVLTFERCSEHNISVVVEVQDDGTQRVLGGHETTSDCLQAVRPDAEWTREHLFYEPDDIEALGIDVDASYGFVVSAGDIQ